MATLDVDSNQLNEIQSQAFRGLPNLKYLSLSNNLITILQYHAFHGLHDLTQLLLNNNEIGCVSNQAFSGLNNLQMLSLTNNNILEIDLKDIPKGTLIYLERNPLDDADDLHGFKKVPLLTHRFQQASG